MDNTLAMLRFRSMVIAFRLCDRLNPRREGLREVGIHAHTIGPADAWLCRGKRGNDG